MSMRDVLRELKLSSAAPLLGRVFVGMFVGVVVAPLVLLAIGGRSPAALGQSGLIWSFAAIALLLLVSVGGGFLMFRRQAHVGASLSIEPKHRGDRS